MLGLICRKKQAQPKLASFCIKIDYSKYKMFNVQTALMGLDM